MSSDEKIHLIRGSRSLEYHKEILAEFIANEMKDEDDLIHVSCVGGGYINIQEESLSIYGYSHAFGKANHQLAADIIQKELGEQFRHLSWKIDPEVAH